jgi:hypothetical protein
MRLQYRLMTYWAHRLPLVLVMLIGGAGLGAAMSVTLPTASLAATDRNPLRDADDTYESVSIAHRVERLQRAFGLGQFQFSGRRGDGRIAIDARQASFIVANSRNPDPTQDHDCAHGSQQVNPYPFVVSDTDNAVIIGGVIVGRIPQTSDWLYTYCNSAALLIRRSPDAIVDGIRIAGGWDGVRATEGSPRLQLVNSWLSDIRDDAVENDYLYSAAIHDTLIDGAFVGVSVKSSGSAAPNGLQETVVLSAVLLRLREYPYRGRNRFGAATKNEAVSPAVRIRNSVVAVDYRGGASWRDYWTRGWSKVIESKNNVFLWLSNEPIPPSLAAPSKDSGFVIQSGTSARRTWERTKQNWVDCHPKIARLPSDPKSDARRCDRNYWGGYGD